MSSGSGSADPQGPRRAAPAHRRRAEPDETPGRRPPFVARGSPDRDQGLSDAAARPGSLPAGHPERGRLGPRPWPVRARARRLGTTATSTARPRLVPPSAHPEPSHIACEPRGPVTARRSTQAVGPSALSGVPLRGRNCLNRRTAGPPALEAAVVHGPPQAGRPCSRDRIVRRADVGPEQRTTTEQDIRATGTYAQRVHRTGSPDSVPPQRSLPRTPGGGLTSGTAPGPASGAHAPAVRVAVRPSPSARPPAPGHQSTPQRPPGQPPAYPPPWPTSAPPSASTPAAPSRPCRPNASAPPARPERIPPAPVSARRAAPPAHATNPPAAAPTHPHQTHRADPPRPTTPAASTPGPDRLRGGHPADPTPPQRPAV
jgi:hypothetical protein